ncbi:hypothetical protein B0H16DRAFT_1701575 [Mycena metata]|uniref:Uncharacterized protein n=1 Tax=Mycena metata TaxID=1033252 RepID=A0AAD7MGG7_9AGAR|nr:hypothetical protein B0H16DRAFT_1701575 [Mycena metata]
MKGLVQRAILATTSRLLLALFSVAFADADISPGICPERDEAGDTLSKIEANVNGPGTVHFKDNHRYGDIDSDLIFNLAHGTSRSTSAQSNQKNERVAEIVGLSIGLLVFCALLGIFFVFRRRRGRGNQEPEADVASSPRQRRTEKFRQLLGIGQSGSEMERLDSERQTHPRGQTLTGRVHMIEARLDALAERLPDAAPPVYGT